MLLTKKNKLSSITSKIGELYFTVLVVILNIGYVFIYPQKKVFFLVAFALFLFITTIILKNSRSENGGFLLLSPFLIPIFLTSFPKQIVFWNFGPADKIVLSWFLFSFFWCNLKSADKSSKNENMSLLFALFMIWASILWLSLIWDVGVWKFYNKRITPDRLSDIYKIWESRPFSEHYGLAFYSANNFAKNAYSGHSQIFLIINYLFVKFIQFIGIGNTKMWLATGLIPFFYSAILVGSMIFVLLKMKGKIAINKFSTQLTLFLGVGFILSVPDFWISLLKYNMDNPFSIMMSIILVLFAFLSNKGYESPYFLFLLCFLSLYTPRYGVILIFTLSFYMHRQFPLKKKVKILGIPFLFASVAFIYPRIIVSLLGYTDKASTILFRSGLDGDTTYYTNIIQAIFSPVNAAQIRPWSSLIPVLIFAAVAFFMGKYHCCPKYITRIGGFYKNLFWTRVGKYRNTIDKEPLENLIFLFSPYFTSVVFFPQAVSIHPYLYDYLLLLPLAYLAMYWSLSDAFQEKIKGPKMYLWFLFMMGLLIFNLTKIAQT